MGLEVRYAGNIYPNVGWAIGDVLLIEPKASDQRIGELLSVGSYTVGYWRRRAGIPSYTKRGPLSPYLKKGSTCLSQGS